MSLLEPSLAAQFLDQYKRLLSDVAGRPLDGVSDFAEARDALYKDGLNATYPMGKSYDASFTEAVRGATNGTFVYAKRYKQGYALKDENNCWHCVMALTTPLEELVPEWVLIDTVVLPYCGFVVCDGLVINQNVFIGRNMINEMIQELKSERRKWSSNKSMQRSFAGLRQGRKF